MLNISKNFNNISNMSAPKIGIGMRIRETRNSMGLSQKAFAELVESSASSMSGYELEDVPIPADILRNIALKCKVSGDWLLTGESPEIMKDLNEKHLIATFREAGVYHEQSEILRYAEWRVKEMRDGQGKTQDIPPHKSKAAKHQAGGR